MTRDGVIDQVAYNRLYARRLLPAFHFANDLAREQGKTAFITIPGLGCGQFAGPFHHQIGPFLQEAIQSLLEAYGTAFSHLQAVYFDPYRECKNERFVIHGIHYMIRPLKRGNENKPQLCPPVHYQEKGDDFTGCELTSIVAWDHVSWPGNDFYIGYRTTDDGVKAAATDAMRAITGISGAYDPQQYKYIPPSPYQKWEQVVAHQNLQLDVKDNLTIYPV